MKIDFVDYDGGVVENVPDKLYKYYGNPEYVLSAIKNKGVYLSKPSSFNDPFDECYAPFHIGSKTHRTIPTFQEIVNYFLSDAEYIEKYLGQIDFDHVLSTMESNKYEFTIAIDDAVKEFLSISGFSGIEAKKIVDDITEKRMSPRINMNDDHLKISCFCENKESLPMWAYYGKSHTGICIEYDTTLLSDDVKQHIHKVNYQNNRNEELVHFSKSVEWEHEKEWRIIVRNYPEDYLPFDCISGIYLGERFDFTTEPGKEGKYAVYHKIINEIKKLNHNIAVYKAEADIEHGNQFYKKQEKW